MHTIKPIKFFAGTDLVVVGTNSEMADFDNPRGEIIRSAGFVYAEDAKGYRVRLHVKTGWEAEAMEAAERLAVCLTARLTRGLLPIRFSEWVEHFPAYGSDAYIESDQGAMDAWLEKQQDEEYAFS